MSRSKQVVADLLFGVQIIFTIVFCGSQFLRMLQNNAQGVSVVLFFSVQAFVTLNLLLARAAHKAQPSRVTCQAVITYAAWVILWGANFSLVLITLLRNPAVMWKTSDSVALFAVGFGLILVFLDHKRRHAASIRDPLTRGYSALVFKTVPQFFQGWKFWVYGPASWSSVAIVVGHVTIFIRLGQLYFSIREAGWDKNRLGSAISEIGNEVSWIVATAIWLMK
jgi:hypothetical protein